MSISWWATASDFVARSSHHIRYGASSIVPLCWSWPWKSNTSNSIDDKHGSDHLLRVNMSTSIMPKLLRTPYLIVSVAMSSSDGQTVLRKCRSTFVGKVSLFSTFVAKVSLFFNYGGQSVVNIVQFLDRPIDVTAPTNLHCSYCSSICWRSQILSVASAPASATVSSSVASATLSAAATKVEAPAVSAVVSPAPTATTYDEQHQIINDMNTGLIVSHVIRLSPLLTTASLISIDRHYLLLLVQVSIHHHNPLLFVQVSIYHHYLLLQVRVSIHHHYLLLLAQVSIYHQYLLLLVKLSIQRHCLLLSQPHGRSYSCPCSHDVDIWSWWLQYHYTI